MEERVERYEFHSGKLIIKDFELDIDYEEVFNPLLIPPQPIPGEYKDHILKMDLGGGYCLEKNGTREGQTLLLYPDGSKKMESFYTGGLLQGPSTFYANSGQILSRSWFVKGKTEGKSYWYYPSGAVYSIQRFRNGLWELKQEYFYESGQIKSLLNYRRGMLDGIVKLYGSHGNLERTIAFKDGKKL